MVEETLTNLEIAHRQLERSIVIFLDDKDYVSALTLAGAAEEILGKLLNVEGKHHWLDDISKLGLRSLGIRKKDDFSEEAKRVKKYFSNAFNSYKNKFKHYNHDGTVSLMSDEAAADMINRAISNYLALTQRETGAMCRFKDFFLRDILPNA